MKHTIRLIILALVLCVLGISAKAQNKTVVPDNISCTKVDFNNLPHQDFPCFIKDNSFNSFDRYGGEWGHVCTTPQELSMYCSQKAQKCVNKAYTLSVTGACFLAVGGFLYGVGTDGSDGALVTGALLITTGGVLESLVGFKLINHKRWDYRRKQVDLYLTPGSATLKF